MVTVDVRGLNSIPIPRYLNDPEYFLIAELTDSVIFSNGDSEVVCPVGTELLIECDELASNSYYLLARLAKHYTFTARIPRSMVGPLS